MKRQRGKFPETFIVKIKIQAKKVYCIQELLFAYTIVSLSIADYPFKKIIETDLFWIIFDWKPLKWKCLKLGNGLSIFSRWVMDG